MEISQERKVLSTANAKVGLYPKYGLGTSILKGVTRAFLGPVPRYFTERAINNWSRAGFFQTLSQEMQVEGGDVKDLLDKQVKLNELTVTSQNFLFLYEKGFISKQQKLLVLPIKNVTTVKVHKRKSVTVSYDMPQDGGNKTQHFDLELHVNDAEDWARVIDHLTHE